ncbi:serine--tRNA ligase [Rhodococcus antarcticus]|uniref:Serine--tRNA ligase n=1 Tax=Rhodococcus antarcticus TaxID=2987751 RepID=A0ABY6NZ65_9NOCA|nr:serine--tRNA ligase [Rhodococcus antarcticus]UZJ24573.1 serine--tRNA ligase [Rhodococcus antarcticus]
MIDLKLVREDPDAVRTSQRTRGEDPSLVDALLTADAARRAAVLAADTLRAEQKTVSGQVGRLMGAWQKAQKSDAPDAAELKATADTARAQAGELSERVKAAELVQAAADSALDTAHRAISNVVQPGAPAGGEDDYVVLSHHGQIPEIPTPRDHLELAEGLRLLDVERGVKVSGARFYFLTGVGALLQLGLLQLAAQKAVANGFTLTIPPVLVRPEIMAGTGFLGAHAAEVYKLADDDLYLVGTSEVPMAGFHADEILDLSAGPKRYAGWSTCFRREAGSYGKDTRGIMRVHQFDKVEMFSWCRPEDADAEHQRLLGWEQEMLAAVDVPYRIIDTAGGDLGSSAARKYDCEAWVPSQEAYRELTSTSNCTTFQARRLNVRYRDEAGRTQVAATLNGTLATTRWIVAILENHQEPDGSVRVPVALQPFVGTDVLRP